MSVPKIRVVHVIVGLDYGGAERMLVKLLWRTRDRVESSVICIGKGGPLEVEVRNLGVPVYILGMKSSVLTVPRALWAVTKLLRAISPDVVQTWMYHSDFLGGIAAKLSGSHATVWNIRIGDPLRLSKASTRLIVFLCASLSKIVPKVIICCAESARVDHLRLGYPADKMRVVPNGFDVETFRPDPVARGQVRAEVRIPDGAPLIGYLARFDPQKNHRLFFEAAELLHRRRPDAHFLLAGDKVDPSNEDIARWMDAAGTGSVTRLLGRRSDVARLTAALDIATLCSTHEGFPNVLGEAMACSVPCVTTDVGDAASILGESGTVVSTGDPQALASAWESLLLLSTQERSRLGELGRKRVEEQFSLKRVAEMYLDIYFEVAAR